MKQNKFIPIFFCGFISVAILFALWAYLGREQTIPEPEIPDDHKLECISYTPLIRDEAPWNLKKTFRIPRERVESDFKLLSQRFSCVRLYSMKGYEEVFAVAEKYGLQLILSAWISQDNKLNEKEVRSLIDTARRYRAITRFVLVGNETLLRHEQTETQMIEWVNRVKKELPDIPVSYGEVLGFWKQYERLAEVVDFLTIHILPYWSNVPPRIEDVANYVEWDYNQMVYQYPGKGLFVGEIGWPSQGRVRERSVPSPVNEARFFRAVIPRMEGLGWHYNIIEAFDQPWKRGAEGCVGAYWGLYDTHRQDKKIFEGRVSNYPEWKNLFLISAVLVVFLMIFVLISIEGRKTKPIAQREWCFWPMVSGIFILTAFSVVKQGHEFILTVFNTVTTVKACLCLCLSLTGTLLFLFTFVLQKVPSPLHWSQFKHRVQTKQGYDVFIFLFGEVVIFFLISISLGLFFAGRSTSLMGFGFLIPVLAQFYFSFSSRCQRTVLTEDVIMGLTLLLVSVGLLINEEIWNLQADLWMGLCVVGALSCWPVFSCAKLKVAFKLLRQRQVLLAFLCVFLVYVGAMMIRFVLIENRVGHIEATCTDNPSLWICQLKNWIGMSIHFRFWGFLAFIIFIAAALFKKPHMAFASLLFALIGLVWYQPFPAAVVFVLVLIYLGTKSNNSNPPNSKTQSSPITK